MGAPFRTAFDIAPDPYTARNALDITPENIGALSDAPSDGTTYGRQDGDWVAVSGGGGGITDAPNDGNTYGRKNLAWTNLGLAYQPLDGDLTALAALGGTNTIYYRSAANTWAAVTVGTGLSFSGGTLANTVTAGGNVSNVGTPTSGQYAKWTGATTIQGVAPATVLSDIGAQPAGSYQPLDGDLTALAALSGTNTIYYRSGTDTWSAVTMGSNMTFSGGVLDSTGGGGATVTPADHGKLSYVSATLLQFVPLRGDKIIINGVAKTIPSAGIAGLTNGGLSASTTYYIYAYDNSGTITGEFSATGHATSTTAGNVGIEIKSGDNTRSLIGMCRTNGSSQFVNDAANRLVRSWFNRDRAVTQAAFSAQRTTTSTSFAELNTEIRNQALIWSDEIWVLTAQGAACHNSTSNNITTSLGIDSATPGSDYPGSVAATGALAAQWMPFGMTYRAIALSEGLHYSTIVGKVGTASTTGNWRGTGAGDQCTLSGHVISTRN